MLSIQLRLDQPSQINLEVFQINENAYQEVVEDKQSLNEMRSLIAKFRDMKVIFRLVAASNHIKPQ